MEQFENYNATHCISHTKSNKRYMASLALGTSFSLSVSLANVMILELVNCEDVAYIFFNQSYIPTYHKKLLHPFSLMLLSIISKNGTSHSINSNCKAMGIVFMPFKER